GETLSAKTVQTSWWPRREDTVGDTAEPTTSMPVILNTVGTTPGITSTVGTTRDILATVGTTPGTLSTRVILSTVGTMPGMLDTLDILDTNGWALLSRASRLKSGRAAAPQVVWNAVQRVGGGKGADSLSRGGERAMADVDTAQEAPSRWAKDAIPVAEEVPPFTFVLVKL